MTDTEKQSSCFTCGAPVDCTNYCDWDCHVKAALEAGGEVHQPNGLPICCIKADGSMWEHEHGDHPDYKFPVTVRYVGPNPKEKFGLVDGYGNPVEVTEEWVEDQSVEDHALLHHDDQVAITIFEGCRATWDLTTGLVLSGYLWEKGEWGLDSEDIEKIKSETVSNTKGLTY